MLLRTKLGRVISSFTGVMDNKRLWISDRYGQININGDDYVEDVNGDGLPDLLVSGFQIYSGFTVYLNQGDLAFVSGFISGVNL